MNMQASPVRIHARPKLNAPNLLAAWPGIGNVSAIAANYLTRKLEFKTLATLEAADFFEPIGVTVKDNVVEAPQFPQNNFYYWKNRRGKSDLIIFVGETQPPNQSYDLAHCILDASLKFGAKRIYTCAAAMTRIHHTEPPRVWGVATNPAVAAELKPYGLMPATSVQIAGMNGLLLGVAKERKIEGVCLLGEVPQYAARIQNPMAALAVLRVLTKILDIEIDLAELQTFAAETSERMKQMASEAMGEYIDLFTEPIWQRNEEEDEGEEGEGEDEGGGLN
ncbi:MAG: PAC2 family protein [Dehalococcoidales bacterium]|nr:PAC2 family protein [Dehalococcoidales bacterium]